MIVVGIIAALMVLMGCDLLNIFIDWNDAGNEDLAAAVAKDKRAAKEADSSTTYYDTGESVMVPEVERPAEEAESALFDNQNPLAVQNGGMSPTFEVASATTITKIQTYHWNDASGSASTGKISLRADGGKVYGPWETVGVEGQGGVPNANWVASPNVTIPPGRYTVIDSDPSTWSQNADSGGEGFVIVHGQVAQ